MNNNFETKLDTNKLELQKKQQEVLFRADDFFSEHGQAIEDYAESAGLNFRPGHGWSIAMETGEATYDPSFFADKGYLANEAMWATCHEVEHFRDWRNDPEIYSQLFARMKTKRRLHILYNCLDDVMVNRQVDTRFPSLKDVKQNLYQTKLFPGLDYTDKPKHLQLAYTMLREKMLPEEILKLDPEVRTAIERLKNIDGQGTDLIKLVSDPTAKAKDRYRVVKDYIEPVYEQFFQEDLEDKKQQNETEDSGEGEESEGEENDDDSNQSGENNKSGKKKGEPKIGEANFADDYDEFDDKLPNTIPLDEIKDEIDKENKRKKEASKTPDKIAEEQFEKQHGVTMQDINRYRRDYEKIKHDIEPLRDIFKKIIANRKEIKRRLKERTDQGVVLDPSLIAQAYIDAESGISDSRTQLKVKQEEFDDHKPNNLEFTVIFDRSGSMNENHPGGKSYEQKLSGILIMEALAEFEADLKQERLEKTLDLHVLTEARSFGNDDEELKPLSDEFDYKTRVKIAGYLSNCNGSSTADYKSLEKIDQKITPEISNKIARGDLKKFVLLITDGGSDDVRQAIKEKQALNQVGVITKAILIGEPDNEDRKKFKIVWQRSTSDGQHCKNVSQLVPTIQKLLQDFLNDF